MPNVPLLTQHVEKSSSGLSFAGISAEEDAASDALCPGFPLSVPHRKASHLFRGLSASEPFSAHTCPLTDLRPYHNRPFDRPSSFAANGYSHSVTCTSSSRQHSGKLSLTQTRSLA